NEMLVEDPPFILDLRSPAELEENGWIEGAVNVPLLELADNLDKLPSFDTTIVGYCGSGWRCTIAMPALEALGWENVLSLTGGSFASWVDAGYPIAEGEPPEAVALNEAQPDEAMVLAMQEMLARIPEGFGGISGEELNTLLVEDPELILIDVRTAAEVEEKGSLDADNVTFIPIEEFVERRDEWPADMDAKVVVYCGSGHRSTIALPILASYGYEDVYSLKGGYGAWAEAGYPVVGAPEPSADLDTAYETFLADMEAYNTISPEALNMMMAEDPPPFLLDVREAGELQENGYIPGAVHIPLRELADNLDLLPSFDTTIVSYCGSGWRCTIALAALEALGWEDVLCLKGGSFAGWAEAGYEVAEGLPSEPMVLDVAEPDTALVAVIGEMLADVPQGFGGVDSDALAMELVENPDLILIDVRTEAEVAENGVIEGENLVVIPLEAFMARKAEWPQDQSASIVVYCGSGHRSTIAMTILWSYGYEDVLSLKGGMAEWAAGGYPVGALAAQ
ncbi:MAG TPA: rhodanese-like domain-containing protein, partial [Candidatus Sulfomarinibacteraceae bacterium]|nr:rhodanese-like domain-containing protein [Candidatus Sulfomarinibacteraceae bacterium]